MRDVVLFKQKLKYVCLSTALFIYVIKHGQQYPKVLKSLVFGMMNELNHRSNDEYNTTATIKLELLRNSYPVHNEYVTYFL